MNVFILLATLFWYPLFCHGHPGGHQRFHEYRQAFMDIKIGGKEVGRIKIDLRGDIVPRTVKNFAELCTGEKGFGYENSEFFRVIPGSAMQGGDIIHNDGTGQKSIYGETFENENYKLKHTGHGIVSMVSTYRGTNGSQFFITFRKNSYLDGKCVVFGKVTRDSYYILKKVEAVGSRTGRPFRRVVIDKCGVA